MTTIAKTLKLKKDFSDEEILDIIKSKQVIQPENLKLICDIKESTENQLKFHNKEEIDEEDRNFAISEQRDILKGVLEMFKFRTHNKYDYEGLLDSLNEIKSNEEFVETILSSEYKNPLRNVLDDLIFLKKSLIKSATYLDILYFEQSFLIRNAGGEYTAVFFIPNLSSGSQIPISVIRLVMSALFTLQSCKNIKISEIMIVHSRSLQTEALKLFNSIRNSFFIQFFSTISILSPVVSSLFCAKYVILSKEKKEAFLKANPNIEVSKLRRDHHSRNPVLSYLGCKSGSLALVIRPSFISGSLANESTFINII